MSFPDDPILDYALRHSSPEDEILTRLTRDTNLHTVYPRMISGPMQGKLLEMICHMLSPKRVLEIGTFTGYSGICLARGLAQGGLLHTIDVNDETMSLACRYFEMAGVSQRIRVHTGDALEIIPGLDEIFDLVFIDGDKEQYISYYDTVFPKLRTGGIILADNVLWGGKVVGGKKQPDKETKGIIDFNIFVTGDRRVEKIMIPIRDGLYLIRKIG